MYGLFLRILKAGAVLLALTAGAAADDYPSKPIRLIIRARRAAATTSSGAWSPSI